MNLWTSEEATQQLLAILPFLNRLVSAEWRQIAGESTTMVQFRVLSHLLAAPLTLSGLAKKRRVSLQAAGEIVQGMVERGWIVRTPDPDDRRQSLLELTDEGRASYALAEGQMVAHLLPFLDKLSPEEIAAIQVALPALHRVLATVDEDSEPL